MSDRCVTRGSSERITVFAHAGLKTAINTEWPDKLTHQEWRAWVLDAPIPPTGRFDLSWTIPVEAPLGQARTDVIVTGKIDGKDAYAFAHGYWEIKKRC